MGYSVTDGNRCRYQNNKRFSFMTDASAKTITLNDAKESSIEQMDFKTISPVGYENLLKYKNHRKK